MKVTKKQREEIIRKAQKEVSYEFYSMGICYALSLSIDNTLKVFTIYDEIKDYIPKFKFSTAEKYFNAKKREDGYWWARGDNKNRLAFLQYLLDGKLPKQGRKQ